ncbi:MAG: Holliday junction resolvase RuvX [Gammaproteobacteria bacterium]|nr:Holliday junction resolvase RuvX [Gammaproteobacteria bacterium]
MSVKTYLCFDVGTKRTGVAIANSLTNKASGIETVRNHKDGSTNWQQIDQIINKHPPDIIVVGVPYDENNKQQEMIFIARSFGRKIKDRFDIEVVFIDEHLSSSEAKNQLKWHYAHKNADRSEVDIRSAQLILQTWLNETRPD